MMCVAGSKAGVCPWSVCWSPPKPYDQCSDFGPFRCQNHTRQLLCRSQIRAAKHKASLP